jgi:hypothetical protein
LGLDTGNLLEEEGFELVLQFLALVVGLQEVYDVHGDLIPVI